MKTVIGIDAGSVSVSMVKMTAGGELLASRYAFHHGDIEGTICLLAKELAATGDLAWGVTDSCPSRLQAQLRVDNQIAVIEAVTRLHPAARTVLWVGGEKFFLCRFDGKGTYLGTISNTSCAAGTGSFLDQQASRLKMSGIAELSETALRNKGACPKIASRCAVFAKTDLIHAQQEGYAYEEISDGLCRGLARNIVDTLFTADKQDDEVFFLGGVAKNLAVARHIEDLASISLIIPEHGHLYGAIGAAMALLNQEEKGCSEKKQILRDAAEEERQRERSYSYPPLTLTLSEYPDFSSLTRYLYNQESNNPVEVDIYEPLQSFQQVHLGIDIGSTSTKAILMNNEGRVMVGLYTRTAGRPLTAVQEIFAAIDDIGQDAGVNFDVASCSTTGSGRKFIGTLVAADEIIDEITAHARAAVAINPRVDTIIEIGGQDAKFTTLRDGRVTSSTMNNVCAAGTGSFIEEQAARLGCGVTEYSDRAEHVRAPLASDRCTVFMERDINHHLSEGFSVNEVLASALHSVRENYLMKVATEKNIGETIFFQGATAKNKALVAAFEQRLKKPILVSKFCHLTGAYGAALVGREEKGARESSFRGIGLHKAKIDVKTEVCELCNNHCKISVADTPHGKVAYGFLCGRDYDTQHYVASDGKAHDLLRVRRQVLRGIEGVREAEHVAYRVDTTIGLPVALHMVDELHLWQSFFRRLSIRTVVSDEGADVISQGKKISKTEFCAPMTALHGHVAQLLERADYIFLPYYLENRNRKGRRQFCYYTQFSPGVIATLNDTAARKVLSPVIRYLYTPFHTKMQLYRMLKKILATPPGFLEVSHAYDQALEDDRKYRQALKDVYRDRQKSDDIEIVLLGRPYSVLSPAMNCGIPGIFASLGITASFQDMVEYDKEETRDIDPLLQELHWHYGVRILETARALAQHDGVYPVYVTSFKCSPDSFVLDYFKTVMDACNKPYLILELDEHDSNVGYETRIEAAVRSFRNHYRQRQQRSIPDFRSINPQYTNKIGDRAIIMPNWDDVTTSFIVSILRREGIDAYKMEETEETIRRSLKYNSGQCIPLNAVAEALLYTLDKYSLKPSRSVLWLGESYLACNIRMYPYHIKTILSSQGYNDIDIYIGGLSLADISLRASSSAYFAYMFGGLLRRVACSIRPYELEHGETDSVLEEAVTSLSEAFLGKADKEEVLDRVIARFEKIPKKVEARPKVAIFGDLYVRDNRIMNQDLIRYIEAHGGEVVTTPYSEYAKMVAPSYFRKWFHERKYLECLSSKVTLATMTQLEKKYSAIFARILGNPLHSYDTPAEKILAQYNVSPESSGESMDNLLKIHYLLQYYGDISLFVQTSPALCCPSIVTEAMRQKIEEKTGVPIVSIMYDGTGGSKNSVLLPYLKYGRKRDEKEKGVLPSYENIV